MPCVFNAEPATVTSNAAFREESSEVTIEEQASNSPSNGFTSDPEGKQTDNKPEQASDHSITGGNDSNDQTLQANDSKMSEIMDSSTEENYEELIKRNIKEKQQVLSSIFSDVNVNEFKPYRKVVAKNKQQEYARRTLKIDLPRRYLPPRRASMQASKRLNLDSDEDVVDLSDEEEVLENGKRRKVIIAFKPRAKRHHIAASEARTIIQANEITEVHLHNVADIVTEKVYSQNGTTCHQCRQKTKDMKTICRSENCSGVRGYFCGPCLRNRYGEDARTALKDPKWKCPPCRNICNCSICRNRAGARATGILTPTAKQNGYASVKEYLDDHDQYIIKYEED